MKNKQPKARERATPVPTKTAYTLLHQIVQHIQPGLIDLKAKAYGIQARTFSVTSHVVALLYGHLAHTFSLNSVCDALSLYPRELARIRGATAPSRNTFSHANRTRDAAFAEDLYWSVFERLQKSDGGFNKYGKHRGFIFRLKRRIYAIDSTLIKLTANCIDWARYRRKKAAAKTHMRIDVGSLLPSFAIVEEGAPHDSTRAADLCEGLRDGDILLADRAYVDFEFLWNLQVRGVFFVLRSKKNMRYEVVGDLPKSGDASVISDQIVRPERKKSSAAYPGTLRLVTALVEVDGKQVTMQFITNNFAWSARTIAELYRARWAIELFFKELKQTLQLTDFYGENENAVKWQIWTALLAHLILRYLKHVSGWALSFTRLVGTVRGGLWVRRDILEVLGFYGTASPPARPVIIGGKPYFQGFFEFSNQPVGQPPMKKA